MVEPSRFAFIPALEESAFGSPAHSHPTLTRTLPGRLRIMTQGELRGSGVLTKSKEFSRKQLSASASMALEWVCG
jgi:hypothetical protein